MKQHRGPFGTECDRDRDSRWKPGLSALRTGPIAGISSKPWSLRDAEGKVLKFVGTTTDIDDQKRAQEALRASETNLRQIVNGIPGLVCTLNPAGQIELANRPLLDFFGMTVEELNSWGTNGAVHPDDLPRVIAELTHSMTTGTPYDSELRYRRADGLYRWSQTRILPVRDAEGRITRWYGLITDIDDRKRAEEESRRSEARKTAILDSALDCVVTIDHEGCITEFNPGCRTHLRISPERRHGQAAFGRDDSAVSTERSTGKGWPVTMPRARLDFWGGDSN